MHFTQKSAIAAAVLASTALAVPLGARAPNDNLNARDDSPWVEVKARDVSNLSARDIEARDFWNQFDAEVSKNVGKREESPWVEAKARDVNTLEARDFWNQFDSEVAKTVGKRDDSPWVEVKARDVNSLEARDFWNQFDAEVSKNVGKRDIETRDFWNQFDAEVNKVGKRDIEARDFWNQFDAEVNKVTTRDLGARDFWNQFDAEVNKVTTRDLGARDFWNQFDAEVDKNLGKRDDSPWVEVKARDINNLATREIEARDFWNQFDAEVNKVTTRDLEGSEWHEVTSRSHLSAENSADLSTRSPAPFKFPTGIFNIFKNHSPLKEKIPDLTPNVPNVPKKSFTDRIGDATNAAYGISAVAPMFSQAKNWLQCKFGTCPSDAPADQTTNGQTTNGQAPTDQTPTDQTPTDQTTGGERTDTVPKCPKGVCPSKRAVGFSA